MLFVIACGLIVLAIVLVTALVEAFARHRKWQGFDTRPVRYEPRRPSGRPW